MALLFWCFPTSSTLLYTAVYRAISCQYLDVDQQTSSFNEICVDYCGISVSVHCPGAITYTYLHTRIWSHHIMVSHVLMGGFHMGHMGHMGWWWMLANGFRLPLDPSLCTKVERSCMEWALDQSPGSSEGCCKSPWCSKEVDAKTIPNQLLGIHFTGSWDWWVICFILPGRRTAFIALCRALISRDLHNAWIPTQLKCIRKSSASAAESDRASIPSFTFFCSATWPFRVDAPARQASNFADEERERSGSIVRSLRWSFKAKMKQRWEQCRDAGLQ